MCPYVRVIGSFSLLLLGKGPLAISSLICNLVDCYVVFLAASLLLAFSLSYNLVSSLTISGRHEQNQTVYQTQDLLVKSCYSRGAPVSVFCFFSFCVVLFCFVCFPFDLSLCSKRGERSRNMMYMKMKI